MSIFLCFLRHTCEAEYGVCGIDPKVSCSEIPSLLVYTSTGRVLGDFVNIFHRDLCREKILPNLARNRSSGRGRGTQDLRSHGEDDFSHYSTTTANQTTVQALPRHGSVALRVVCHLESSVGTKAPVKKASKGLVWG